MKSKNKIINRSLSVFSFFIIGVILLVSSTGSFLPDANAEYPVFTTIIDNTAGTGVANTLEAINDLTVDSLGNTYTVGVNSMNAFKITSDGIITEIIDSTGDGNGNILELPVVIEVDSLGNAYVVGATSDNVFKITPSGIITEIIDSTGDGNGNPLDAPYDITVDSLDNVYVSGYFSSNVFKITPSGTITEIIDSTGDGQGNSINNAMGLATDSLGNVYVSGVKSDNVFKITPSGTITEIIDSTGDGTGNKLGQPRHIVIDSLNNVYISGSFYDNVFKITPSGIITKIFDNYANGTIDYIIVGLHDIAVDSLGNVYVTIGYGDVMFKVTPDGTTTKIVDCEGNSIDHSTILVIDLSDNIYVIAATADNILKITFTHSDDECNSNSTINNERAVGAPVQEDDVKSGGGSANKHKTKPTFGIDHKTNIQKITGGFSVNDESFDITDNFWTPFEYKTLKIGETNSFAIKVFAEQKLRVQEFLFGIPNVGDAYLAELQIEVFYDHSGEIEKINVNQRTDVIDKNTLDVEQYPSKCLSDETEEKCITTTITMKFLEPLKDDIMALKAIDYKNRYIITYLNDGFDISGESLNPMVTKMIPGPEKYEGPIKVTQTAKYSDLWLADDNRAFTSKDAEAFVKMYQATTRVSDDPNTNTMTRMHSYFDAIKGIENYKASLVMKSLCSKCADESFNNINDIFAYEYPVPQNSLDNPEIQSKMLFEAERAQIIYDKLLMATAHLK